MAYTKKEIQETGVKEAGPGRCVLDSVFAVLRDRPGELYGEDMVNYTGKCKAAEKGEKPPYYTEAIADAVLTQLKAFRAIRPYPYPGEYNITHELKYAATELRPDKEKHLAQIMWHKKDLDELGTAVNFEVPLQKGSMTRVDLVTVVEDKDGREHLTLVEMKKLDSPETLLRCALEIGTYSLRMHPDRMLEDFRRDYPGLADIRLAVLTGEESRAAAELKEINTCQRQRLKALLQELKIYVYTFDKTQKVTLKWQPEL